MFRAIIVWLGSFFFFISFDSYAQEDYLEAKVSWLKSSELLYSHQLNQLKFEEKSPEKLEAKSYYYVKVSISREKATKFPFLACDNFYEVAIVFTDSLVSVNDLGWDVNTLPITFDLPDSLQTNSHFYLRCYNYRNRSFPWFGFYWLNKNFLDKAFKSIDDNYISSRFLPNMLTTGLIVTFIIFFSALFISNPGQKVYLHYILYLIPLGLYLFHRSYYVHNHLFSARLIQYPFWFVFTNYPMQVYFHMAYIIFTFTFLEAKRNYPLYYRVGYITIVVSLVYGIILTIGMYLQPYGPIWVISFHLERVLMTVFGFWMNIYVISYRKDNIALIVPTGSIIFLLGAWGAFFYHMNLMRLGAILEVLFFSLGIGYKFKLERKEKDQIKTALISQLKENELIQKNYNIELEKEVKIRSEELIEKTKQVEEEKKQKMKAQLENKVEEMKMIALRSQMNPHFLFNSLNSIRHLIIKHKTTEAYDYLSDFASLMRSVLENSEKDAILLNHELEVIKTYISLEKLRFKKDFNFRLMVDEEVIMQDILVPPLIIQPFLENAIIHGLVPKTTNKLLTLDIQIIQQHLVIKVEDNGIGRKTTLESTLKPKNKPMAISIAQDRLNLFVSHYNKEYHLPTNIRIKDKQSQTGSPMGTVVFIELPLIKIN